MIGKCLRIDRWGRSSVVVAGAVALLFSSSQLSATAMYEATAEFSLTIDRVLDASGNPVSQPSELEIVASTFYSTGDKGALGNAFADYSGDAVSTGQSTALTAGDSLTLSGSADGWAAKPWGSAASYSWAFLALGFINGTGSQYEIEYSWEYAYSGEISVSNVEKEFAFATASLFFTDSVGGEFVNEEEEIFSDPFFSFDPFDEDDADSGSLTISANDFEQISGFIAVAGGAEVPEPGTLALLLIGAAGLTGRRVARIH